MDHAEAVRIKAAERYLLCGLKDPELNQFEDHLFDCAICAEDVTVGVLFADNAAAELKYASAPAPERAETRRNWWEWLSLGWRQPAFVMPLAALAIVSGLWMRDHSKLTTELATAEAPQSFTEVPLEDARGSEPAAVARNARVFAVSFFIDSPNRFPQYAVEITGEGLGPVVVGTPAPPPGASFNLLLPTDKFKPGRYRFVVHGGPSTDGAVLKTFTLNVG
jgi:hypothetical protein